MSFRKRTIPAAALGAALALAPVLLAAQPAGALTPEEQSFVDAINSARAAAGLAPLTVSDALTLLAEQHSAQMGSTGTIFHTTSLSSSIGAVYPNWTHIGENVGMGSSVQQINSAFFASPEHSANIYGDYNLLGVGVYTNNGGVMFVTELFAKAVVATTTAVTTTTPTTTTSTATAPTTSTATMSPTTLTASAAAATSTASPAPSHGPKAHASHAATTSPAAMLAHTSATGAARAAAGSGGRHGPPPWAHNKNHHK
jgi:hypothetical protein